MCHCHLFASPTTGPCKRPCLAWGRHKGFRASFILKCVLCKMERKGPVTSIIFSKGLMSKVEQAQAVGAPTRDSSPTSPCPGASRTEPWIAGLSANDDRRAVTGILVKATYIHYIRPLTPKDQQGEINYWNIITK